MQSGPTPPKVDQGKLIKALSAVEIESSTIVGSRINGSRQAILQRLDALARQAVAKETSDEKKLRKGKRAERRTGSIPGVLEALIASIRNLDDPQSKARLAVLVSCMARRRGDDDDQQLAEKLTIRALNYAERVADDGDRALEILRVVDIATEDDGPRDFEDSIRHVVELAHAQQKGEMRTRIACHLVEIADKIDLQTLISDDLRQEACAARQDASTSEAAQPEAPRQDDAARDEAPKPTPPLQAASGTAPVAAKPKEGFVDPAAGIVFPTRSRRRR